MDLAGIRFFGGASERSLATNEGLCGGANLPLALATASVASQLATRNSQLATLNSQLSTLNSQLSTLTSHLSTQHLRFIAHVLRVLSTNEMTALVCDLFYINVSMK